MTATVNPGAYSDQVSRGSSEVRTQNYLQALKFWATHPDPRIEGIVFCENSGADLGTFEKMANGLCSPREIELLSFRGNDRPEGVHYGYAELGTIDYASRNSLLVRKHRHFVKATGRYVFPRITQLIDSLHDDVVVAIDCRRAYRQETGVRFRARSQLMVFERKFYDRELWGKHGDAWQLLPYRRVCGPKASSSVCGRKARSVPSLERGVSYLGVWGISEQKLLAPTRKIAQCDALHLPSDYTGAMALKGAYATESVFRAFLRLNQLCCCASRIRV
jgi:hypothetical protein